MDLQREVYTEERDGGVYYIPKSIWVEACRSHPNPTSKKGSCKICGSRSNPLYGGMCQNCAIFTSVLDIAKKYGVKIEFRSFATSAM